MRVSRRQFMQAVGGAAGVVALAGDHIASARATSEDLTRWATPEEAWVASICQQCPGGCGLLVRTLDDQAAGLRGNPDHPVNRGGLCPKAFGALQLLYDPNRVRGPLIRDGERGRFRSIGWNDALARVTARLRDLRAKRLSHTVAILGGQYRGYRDTLWARFAEAYGTPNYIRMRCLHPEEPALAHRLMQGVTAPVAYDLQGARCILSFGVGLLESWLGPVHASAAFAELRSADRPRGRLIHVDPRRSQTAAKADRWVPIVPGTDGVLALGIANALIREGLYDRDFIEQHAQGFDEWTDARGREHPGFKDLVLGEYGLVTASTATGVPVRTILEIARDLATLKPAIVLGERGPAYGPDDLHTRMAIHSLNALVGAIGARGGLVAQSELPLAPLPPVRRDDVAGQGLQHTRMDGARRGRYLLVGSAPEALAQRMLADDPYPINVVFLFATNPLANRPDREAFARALDRVPFVVSFSPFLDETTSRADLILPDHTYLERWQDDQVTHIAGFTCVSVASPATTPIHDTRNTADVVLDLARAVGGTVSESAPWERYEQLLQAGARGLWQAGRGYVVSTPAEEALRRVLERQGYWSSEFPTFEKFWAALVSRGAWWDPTDLPASRKTVLRTASGKFEFAPLALAEKIDETIKRDGPDAAFIVALGGRDRADRLQLPVVPIPERAEPGEFPLRLNTYRLITRPIGGGGNQPWLLEQPAVHVRASWERWIELHPDVAARVNVHDNDLVWVESPKGRIRLRAKLTTGTHPDVVNVPLFGGEGPSQNDLIANEPDPSTGFGLLNTTRVRVRKA